MRTVQEQLGGFCLSFTLACGVPVSCANPAYGIPTSILCFFAGKTLIEDQWRRDKLTEQTRASTSTLPTYQNQIEPPAYTANNSQAAHQVTKTTQRFAPR